MRPDISSYNVLYLGGHVDARVELEAELAESSVTMIYADVGVHLILRTRLFFDDVHPGETFEIQKCPLAPPNLVLIKRLT